MQLCFWFPWCPSQPARSFTFPLCFSSLWDYTLLQHVPPAICPFRLTPESFSALKNSRKFEITRFFSAWQRRRSRTSQARRWRLCLRAWHLITLLRGGDVSHPATQWYCVWMSRWAWVTVKCMSVREKEKDKGEKMNPLNALQYVSRTLSSALALLWNFVLFRGKRKNIPD